MNLINNNYEITIISHVDHIYLCVKNLISLNYYETIIHSYDLTSLEVRTINELSNIFNRACKYIEEHDINISDPNLCLKTESEFEKTNNDYIVFKLLEQSDAIILTVYYNIIICFELNFHLNKVKTDNSLSDKTEINFELESDNNQITELKNQITELKKNIEFVFDILCNVKVGEYKLNTSNIEYNKVSDGYIYHFFQLKTITINCNSGINDIIYPYNNSAKILIVNSSSCICNNCYNMCNGTDKCTVCNCYGNRVTNKSCFIVCLSKLPNIERVEYNNCVIGTQNNKTSKEFINTFKDHPNKSNIELIIRKSPWFNDKIEELKMIGLKKLIVE
jgi:hypothetical protein